MRTRRKSRRAPRDSVKRKSVYQCYGRRIEIAGRDIRSIVGNVLQKANRCIHTSSPRTHIESISSLSAFIVSLLKQEELSSKDFDRLQRGMKLILGHADAIFHDECWGAPVNSMIEFTEAMVLLRKEIDIIETSRKLLEEVVL